MLTMSMAIVLDKERVWPDSAGQTMILRLLGIKNVVSVSENDNTGDFDCLESYHHVIIYVLISVIGTNHTFSERKEATVHSV